MASRSRVADILHNESPYRKTKIPKALREQVWLKCMGEKFDGKCKVTWCKNRINVFDFQCGHNIPESKGGNTTLDNLVPICARCNISMGSQYTIDEWNTKFAPSPVVETVKVGCMIAALDRFRYKPSSQV
jgi:5-methylcytosine-specific restriction endonuclease McrA